MDLLGIVIALSGLWFVITVFLHGAGTISLVGGLFLMGLGLCLMDWRALRRRRR